MRARQSTSAAIRPMSKSGEFRLPARSVTGGVRQCCGGALALLASKGRARECGALRACDSASRRPHAHRDADPLRLRGRAPSSLSRFLSGMQRGGEILGGARSPGVFGRPSEKLALGASAGDPLQTQTQGHRPARQGAAGARFDGSPALRLRPLPARVLLPLGPDRRRQRGGARALGRPRLLARGAARRGFSPRAARRSPGDDGEIESTPPTP